ncbi:vegetative incompatibility HET-E-1 [Cordyceps militaris]|uniref:Vegetative incompatibility HET-E-1 n=1 Tax=Cordyceps militaris TaxID=73501 RepID=A0A2H4S885_CORMI|nr:vegetative incompatibility HET-E-1 [Cordyceps militaris]
MERAQARLLTFVPIVVATVYLVLAVRAESSRQQAQIEGHPADDSKDQTRKRLTIVYPEQTGDAVDDAEIDIIAVHGLGSNADWSWVYQDGDKHVNWLRDPNMLPAKIPKARIVVYRYDSTWHSNAPRTRLQLCGEGLVHSLHSFRSKCPKRPLIFVGHSLGGNVILQAILHANDNSRYTALLKSTAGVVFLGTPFRGSKWQPLANALALLMGPAGSHRGITRELAFDAPVLGDRLQRFCSLLDNDKLPIKIACFFELHETDYGRRLGIAGVVKGMVVEEASACISGHDRYPLEKDHLKINKYYGPTDPAFETVSDVISEMCRTAKAIPTEEGPAPANVRKCLQELKVRNPEDILSDIKRQKGERVGHTCEWILERTEFSVWLSKEESQLLRLIGPPV